MQERFQKFTRDRTERLQKYEQEREGRLQVHENHKKEVPLGDPPLAREPNHGCRLH